MKKFLKWIAIVIAVIVVAIVLFFVGMRFHDGPLEIVSGGPFKSGELVSSPAQWSFLEGRPTIQFQTLSPETSRTVWLVVHQGRLFIISGYMTTNFGKLWKQWPHYIEDDDRVILRVDDKLYEQRLERIRTGEIIEPVMEKFGDKYGFEGRAEAVTEGYSWLYEVKSR
ncbi:MAG: hypothetical protein HUJ31_06540 [Pseudomonadales bacterium]|nr:hypothetical protein [Pseudomonadales bacterium]